MEKVLERVCMAPADPRRLVEDVVAIAQPHAQAKVVQVRAELPPELPNMMIDEVQVKQMLVNLVQNAIDAVASGTGVITLRATGPDDQQRIKIEVADNGCGIPPENLSKMFTPFFTTKEMGKGTGLGLAIAYGIVKMHAGDIDVRSTMGKGTTFTILLPVSAQNNNDITQS
jgi:two-component system NtrC family sensor kinase